LTLPAICRAVRDCAGACDRHVYPCFIHPRDTTSDSIERPGPVCLARSSRDRIVDRRAPAFLAGRDGKGRALSAELRRYLLMTDHQAPHSGNLSVFNSPESWGRWTAVLDRNQSEGAQFVAGRIERRRL
jgi:hypothetical protein